MDLKQKPKEIKKSLAGVEILWGDQKKELLSFGWLRENCSCAVCREMKIKPQLQSRQLTVQSMELIGNYALGILWADGHRSIFSFDRLRDHDLQPIQSAISQREQSL